MHDVGKEEEAQMVSQLLATVYSDKKKKKKTEETSSGESQNDNTVAQDGMQQTELASNVEVTQKNLNQSADQEQQTAAEILQLIEEQSIQFAEQDSGTQQSQQHVQSMNVVAVETVIRPPIQHPHPVKQFPYC